MKVKSFIQVAAVSLLVLSCNKQEMVNAEGEGRLMSLDVQVDAAHQATRAAQISTLEAFKNAVSAMDIRVYDDSKALQSLAPVVATLNSGKTQYEMANYYWKLDTKLSIFAIAPKGKIYEKDKTNLADTAPATVADTNKFEFTYDITGHGKCPTTLPDLMVSHYYGTGDVGTNKYQAIAALRFSHALSAVTFQADTMIDIKKVNSISITGIYGKGDCSVKYETSSGKYGPSFSWTDQSDTSSYKCTESSVKTEWPTVKEDALFNVNDSTFMVIPQTTPSDAKVVLNVNTERFTGGENIFCSFKSVELKPGYHYTFKIKYKVEGMMEITLADSSPIDAWTEDSSSTTKNALEMSKI